MLGADPSAYDLWGNVFAYIYDCNDWTGDIYMVGSKAAAGMRKLCNDNVLRVVEVCFSSNFQAQVEFIHANQSRKMTVTFIGNLDANGSAKTKSNKKENMEGLTFWFCVAV